MFEKHKEKLALAAHEAALQDWNEEMHELQFLLSVAAGHSSPAVTALMLKKGEVGVCQVTNVGLVEERSGTGHWQGTSRGVSIPIARLGGRSVRYRVGSSRGHYVKAAPVATAVDHGTMTITSQRLVYQGTKKTSECAFTKLLGIQHSSGGITVSVSNRQKPTVLHFGEHLDDWVSNRLNVALALFNGDAAATLAQLKAQINELTASKPS